LGNLTSAKGYGAMLKVVHFHANLVVHFGRDRTPTFEDLILSVTETLCYFEDVPSEVLGVFGFYTKSKN
jgi:hypothetical protein